MTELTIQRRMLRTLKKGGPMTITDLAVTLYGTCTEQQWEHCYRHLNELRLIGQVTAVPTATGQTWITRR